MMDDINTISSCKAFVLSLIEKKAKLPAGFGESFDYMQSGHIDSMGLIKFMLEIEAKYDIEITEDDMESPDFRTIGGIVLLIKNKLETHHESTNS